MTEYSAQIDQIKQAGSLQEILDIARQFSVKENDEGGIFISPSLGI